MEVSRASPLETLSSRVPRPLRLGHNRKQQRPGPAGETQLHICLHTGSLSWMPEPRLHPQGRSRLWCILLLCWALCLHSLIQAPELRKVLQEHYAHSPAGKMRLSEVRSLSRTPKQQNSVKRPPSFPPKPILQMKKRRLGKAIATQLVSIRAIRLQGQEPQPGVGELQWESNKLYVHTSLTKTEHFSQV